MASNRRAGTRELGTLVALLRGVNVSDKHPLPMNDLAAMFVDAGCGDVQTYIKSGNVVCQASQGLARRVPALVTAAIAARLGFRAPVVTRSADELYQIVRHNPLLRAGMDAAALHVVFLADLPVAAKLATLDPNRSPPDVYAVRGREIYLHCPNGVARTKLTNEYFDTKLATRSTMRNWRTVLRLLELAGE